MAQKVKGVDPDSKQATKVKKAFDQNVNMTAGRLEKWLKTDAAKEVGQKSGSESVGHKSGRRIVKILRTRKADLDAKDYAHMKKVNGYVERHLKQRPEVKSKKKLRETDWAASLKNWGHDPTR